MSSLPPRSARPGRSVPGGRAPSPSAQTAAGVGLSLLLTLLPAGVGGQPAPSAPQIPAAPPAAVASPDAQQGLGTVGPLVVRVVLSKQLGPYRLALQGLRAGLPADAQVSVVSPDDLAAALGPPADLTLAVGPEAARACRGLAPGRTLFLMVLDPQELDLGAMPGVSLAVPVPVQLRRLAAALPGVVRLGLLYDPRHNAELAEQAARAGPALGIRLVPLAVSARQDIPAVLAGAAVAALWLVPDRTVVSRSSLDFVLRRAAAARLPVVGFNRWFVGHGAVLAFAIDYEGVGRQAAARGVELLGQPAAAALVEGPRDVSLLANLRAARRLGVGVRADVVQDVSE